jgi:D-alanyl-D-alanine dipeptidase
MQAHKIFIALALILDIYYSNAQNGEANKYGLAILFDKNEFLALVKNDSSQAMIELKTIIPDLRYELLYATNNNFTKQRMYPKNTAHTFLRLPAARALQRIQLELKAKGYGLKIWDAYRPYSVTEAFWELIQDERYVADPKKGSGHNRGIAVDLTVIHLKSGKELNMGTGFDNFTDTAHHSFEQLPAAVLQNRQLLRATMEKHGFVAFPSEWWHYSLPNPASFTVLDIPFKTLKKITSNRRSGIY